MAWNPSPEVAVARDAAKRLGDCANTGVKTIVILYFTDDDRLGLATYGRTLELCADAKKVGEALYRRVLEAAGGDR